MKKNILYYFLIIILVLLSYKLGYYIGKVNFHLNNNQIEINNENIIKTCILIRKENQQLKEKLEEEKKLNIEKKYIHPIDKKEAFCINKAQNSVEIRDCIYQSEKNWEKEIQKYIDLLKKYSTPEQYKTIQSSQDLWLVQYPKDQKIIFEYIFNHGGTMYFDIAASEDKNIVKQRAEFLKTIYSIHKTGYY